MDVYARRRLVAVLAIVLVLVLIGVAVAGGGDDEEAPITTVTGTSDPALATPLSKDEFIAQGDAICEEAAAGVANLTSNDSETLAGDELEITESQLDQLRTLVPPEEDQKTLDQFFAAMEDQVDALDKRVLALERADDAAALEAETELATASDELLAAAKDYGFSECGRAGEPTTNTDTETEVPTDAGAVPAAPATTVPAPATTPATPVAPPADSSSSSSSSGSDSGGVSP